MRVVAKWIETEREQRMAVVELELELKIVGVVAGRLKGIGMEKMVVDGEVGRRWIVSSAGGGGWCTG